MAEKPPGLLNEFYRVGAGAAADTVDAVTGLPNALLSAVGLKYRTPHTELGPMVPQPFAPMNRILREAVPLSTGIGAAPREFSTAATTFDKGLEAIRAERAAARVDHGLKALKEARTTPLTVDTAPAPVVQSPVASEVEPVIDRRKVLQGAAAVGAAVAGGAKLKALEKVAPVAKAAKAVKAAHPKVIHDAWERLLEEGGRDYEWEPSGEIGRIIKAHEHAAATTTNPVEKAAHEKALNEAADYIRWNKENETAYNSEPIEPHSPLGVYEPDALGKSTDPWGDHFDNVTMPLQEENDSRLLKFRDVSHEAASMMSVPFPKMPKNIGKIDSIDRIRNLESRLDTVLRSPNTSKADKELAQVHMERLDARRGQIDPYHPAYQARKAREFDQIHPGVDMPDKWKSETLEDWNRPANPDGGWYIDYRTRHKETLDKGEYPGMMGGGKIPPGRYTNDFKGYVKFEQDRHKVEILHRADHERRQKIWQEYYKVHGGNANSYEQVTGSLKIHPTMQDVIDAERGS